MSNRPSISVVLATYNRAQFLADSIESVLQQSYTDFELIVVDDGSTDDTPRVVEPYLDRIHFLRRSNGGPSAARNYGVQHAQAEWIAMQDSDDLWEAYHLEALWRYVDRHPDVAMVFANGSYLEGPAHGRDLLIPKDRSLQLASKGVKLADVFDKSLVRVQAAIFSKAAYERVGGHNENLRICGDLELALRLIANYPVGYVDDAVFRYRKHDGNIGRNQELRLVENIQVIQNLLRDHPEIHQQLGADRIARRLAYRYYRLAKSRRKDKAFAKASEAIKEAVRLRPSSIKYQLYRLFWAA